MSIDINSLSPSQVHGIKDDTTPQKPSEQAPARPDQAASVDDTVSLSDDAVKLGKTDMTAISAPVVDTGRVEQVKQALADGSYVIDADKIADKLLKLDAMFESKD